ncbi:MAG: metal ABC transporter ATP-binding protein [Neomegalonema sp.]|nr:metal ABC transporter ATP-binding protein [Neomegalonema sp.]
MTPAELKLAAFDGEATGVAPDPAEIALAAEGVTVAYGKKPALLGAGFAARRGRRLAIMGPNGAGKSTLLKAALGLIPRLSGETRLFGAPVSRRKALARAVAYVPQRAAVDWDFPASVLDVALMGLHREIGWARAPRSRHRDAAMGYLAQLGMEAFADRPIGQLSGGQQQRVFLARALAQNAPIIALDEPFAGVDAATERRIVDLLASLTAEGRTIIAVHHDLTTARGYFDDAVLLNCTVISRGPIEEALSRDALGRAYGGRLADTQLDAATG